MRIGIDGMPLRELKTGVGHYTFEVARALASAAPEDEFELVSPDAFLSEEASAKVLPGNLRFVRSRENIIGRRWWAIGLPRYIRRARLQLFHGTNYEVPLRGSCTCVLTIHDLSLLLHPETHETKRVVRARIKLPLMTRRADMIITPTESVRREVCEELKVEPGRVVAVPEAARIVFRRLEQEQTVETRRRLNIEDEFLLTVGTIEPRKNLQTLLAAFEDVTGATRHRPQLVIVGREGWKMKGLAASVEKSVVSERVRWTGYLPDEDLAALYSSCSAFIYPSVYEGFGLPPLEAMQCGAPVITSNIPSLAETTGGAALLFAPLDRRALGAAIVRLLEDETEREQLSTAGQLRARQFSWEETARLTREVYDEALRRSASSSG